MSATDYPVTRKETKFSEWDPFEHFKSYYYYLYNSHVCVCYTETHELK